MRHATREMIRMWSRTLVPGGASAAMICAYFLVFTRPVRWELGAGIAVSLILALIGYWLIPLYARDDE